MTPFIDPRAARAFAALGALGAASTFTINAHGAPLNPPALSTRPLATFRGTSWIPSDTAAVRRIFSTSPTQDRTATAIARMTRSADQIARLPYVWGGGHGSFDAAGYDCSGSVSHVLHAAGLLSTPEDSAGLESFGAPGPGRHVTIYANAGHAWMTIDGRRFDTIAFQETGTRWSSSIGSASGYTVRHPPGL